MKTDSRYKSCLKSFSNKGVASMINVKVKILYILNLKIKYEIVFLYS